MTNQPDISPEGVARALEGVTPGPWENRSYQSGTVQVLMRQWNNAKPNPLRDGSMYGYMSAYMTAYNIGWQDECAIDREKQANARFIAYAREAVPALAARLAEVGAEAGKMLAEADSEYNRKTNAMIARHAEVVGTLKRRAEAADAALAASEARVEKMREALNNIDALDPESKANGCSPDALRGLLNRMGEIARTALEETKP
jgi:hypothetical protein